MDKIGKVVLFGLVLIAAVFACGCVDESVTETCVDEPVTETIDVTIELPDNLELEKYSTRTDWDHTDVFYYVTNTGSVTYKNGRAEFQCYSIDNTLLYEGWASLWSVQSGGTQVQVVYCYTEGDVTRIEIQVD